MVIACESNIYSSAVDKFVNRATEFSSFLGDWWAFHMGDFDLKNKHGGLGKFPRQDLTIF